METVNNNQLQVIEKSIDIFKGGPAILVDHQSRSAKAMIVADSILKQWSDAFAIEDPEQRAEALAAVDQRSNKFLSSCAGASTEMQESRKAITQLMDMMKKMFTEEENKLDPKKGEKPMLIQGNRNKYARWVIEEDERKRKIAEVKAAKAKEEVEIRAHMKNQIAQVLLNFLSRKKVAITTSFNAISLADFEDKSGKLTMMQCGFPIDKLQQVLDGTENAPGCILPLYSLHSDDEARAIINQEMKAYDYGAFKREYVRQISEVKESLIDKLPSKKQELLDQKRIADEAEARRQEEIKKQQEAERIRQEQIQMANAAEKKRLEEKAIADRKAEAEKLAQLEKENEERRIAAENEQKQREKNESDRMGREDAEARRKAQEESDLHRVSGTAQVLFDQVSESSVLNPAPETRQGFEITVLHPAGWVEIFQFWFQREGCKMKAEDMGKKSLDQMKKFVEGVAKKDGEKIESKFLKYETSVKAVNRKIVTP